MSERTRYIGTETEFAVDPASLDVSGGNFALKVVQKVHEYWGEYYSRVDGFLSQGGRFYLDLGSHPEYATPECFNAKDAALQELIGESFAVTAFRDAFSNQEDSPATSSANRQKVRLSKRTTDSVKSSDGLWSNSSWGSHENYQVERAAFESLYQDSIYRSLAAHQVSRIIYTGSGGYLGNKYYLSPRAYFHHDVVGKQTTMGREIVNTRDEPLVHDQQRWRRLHVISGDANISPWAIQLKLGSTALLLKAMESEVRFDDLCPVEPVGAFHVFAQDETLAKTLSCQDGEKRSALAIQAAILERVRPFAECDEELQITEEWSRGLKALERLRLENKVSNFLWSIDWFARQAVIERKQSSQHSPRKIDRLYSQLSDSSGTSGIGQRLRELGVYRLTPSDWSAAAADQTPRAPRAKLRGLAVERIRFNESVRAGHTRRHYLARTSWRKAWDSQGREYNFPDNPTPAECREFKAELKYRYPSPQD